MDDDDGREEGVCAMMNDDDMDAPLTESRKHLRCRMRSSSICIRRASVAASILKWLMKRTNLFFLLASVVDAKGARGSWTCCSSEERACIYVGATDFEPEQPIVA